MSHAIISKSVLFQCGFFLKSEVTVQTIMHVYFENLTVLNYFRNSPNKKHCSQLCFFVQNGS